MVYSAPSRLIRSRQRLRSLFGRDTADTPMTWRERFVQLLDHYTPRYRWEHTQDEVKGFAPHNRAQRHLVGSRRCRDVIDSICIDRAKMGAANALSAQIVTV